ncbi:MAG TPA: hypothetical protein PLQ03_02945 [Brevundimonas sp.]|uniref:hypothetical protein n=1 Tax=Brevundimonas sp. TaxID=1871086 RepID=UPI0026186B55|nr:hypothetical protein [Brevundimonas sp.]HRO32345.1 hypothetical protein [Brevundimonas sp.]
MKKSGSEWWLIIAIALGGAAVIALTASGDDREYGKTFVYALVGLVILTASMIGTIFTIGRIGQGTEAETGMIGVACLIGIFVTTPIAFWIVFGLLDRLWI